MGYATMRNEKFWQKKITDDIYERAKLSIDDSPGPG